MPVLNSTSTSEGYSDSRSTSTSTTTPGIPKAKLIEERNRTVADLSALTQALTGADTAQQEASKAAASAIERMGGDRAAAERALGEQAAAKADADARARQVFGTNLADPTADAVKFAAERHDRWLAADAVKGEIQRSEQVSFVDDPLGFMVNTVRVPMLKRTYNEQVALNTELSQRINTLENETIAAQNLDTGLTAKTARAVSDAKAAEALSQSIAQSKQVLAQSAIAHAGAVMQQSALTGKPMEIDLQLAGLTATHTTTNVGHSESYRTTDAERDSARSEKLRNLDLINLKRRAAGETQPYTEAYFDTLSKQEQSALMKNAMITGSFDSSVGDSLKWLDAQGLLAKIQAAPPGTPAAAAVQTLYQLQGSQAYRQARQDMAAPGTPAAAAFAKMSPIEQSAAAMDKAVGDIVQNHFTGPKKNYLTVPVDTPLYFSPVFAAQQPELAQNWVTGFVKQKTLEQPQLLTTPGGVRMETILTEAVGRAVAMARAGKSAAIPKLAAELSAFARSGQEIQYREKGALLGLPKPVEYVASGHLTETTGKALQLWSPAEVEQYLMLNARNFAKMQGVAGAVQWNKLQGVEQAAVNAAKQ